MSNILCKEELLAKKDKTRVSGYALIRSYSEQPTKNGSTYLLGSLDAVGEVQFKIWKGACFDKVLLQDLQGKICLIEAEVNEFSGTKSLIISEASEVPAQMLESLDLKEKDFVVSKYDVDAYWVSFFNLVRKHTSEEAFKVFSLLMNEVEDSFKEEFAAVYHHDNCRGGLLAHSTKVVKLSAIITIYPEILKRVSSDLLYVGSAIHDLGKVVEYSKGSISSKGKIVSHLVFGCLMIEKHRDEIIELKGEDFYYSLLSIISQHHGEYGERPRTVAALIVHQLDLIESSLTSIETALESTQEDGQIMYDGYKLV